MEWCKWKWNLNEERMTIPISIAGVSFGACTINLNRARTVVTNKMIANNPPNWEITFSSEVSDIARSFAITTTINDGIEIC